MSTNASIYGQLLATQVPLQGLFFHILKTLHFGEPSSIMPLTVLNGKVQLFKAVPYVEFGLHITVDVESFVAAAINCLNKSVLKRARSSYHGPCRVEGDLILGHLVFFWLSLHSLPRWLGYRYTDSLLRAIDYSLVGCHCGCGYLQRPYW